MVGKFLDCPEERIRQRFFFQLLLATELYLRVQARDHEEEPKAAILKQMPPKVAWDLALAQRWLENMSIARSSMSAERSTFDLILRSRRRQKDSLRTLAHALKWPNMEEVEYILAEQDATERVLEERSAESMSWFSGVILPGPTLPFIAINALIECDKDTDQRLGFLSHMYPNCGFQYRGSTYWSNQSIVGKVLGACRGVKEVAGWIGPCPSSPDLDRIECLLTHQFAPHECSLAEVDIEAMAARSSPVGVAAGGYSLANYNLFVPDINDITNMIRMERLSFREVPVDGPPDNKANRAIARRNLRKYDATIVFAITGDSFYLKCKYNVDFVCAFECVGGPHALWTGYKYRAVKVDDGLIHLKDWAEKNGKGKRRDRSVDAHRHAHSRSVPTAQLILSSEDEDRSRRASDGGPLAEPTEIPTSPADRVATCPPEVLVIEAFGVSDNEVFARAWCAHWGLNALVANLKRTCLACAVREAYAACLSVIILTEGGLRSELENEGVLDDANPA